MEANTHKYPVSAMCRVLQVSRSAYYYEAKQRPDESGPASEIKEIFRTGRNNYGTRKIKNETFEDLKELKLKLWDYVNWYNHHRIHSSLELLPWSVHIISPVRHIPL